MGDLQYARKEYKLEWTEGIHYPLLEHGTLQLAKNAMASVIRFRTLDG